MVNGNKPTMTLNGAVAPVSPVTKRQTSRTGAKARSTDNFASFLPPAEMGTSTQSVTAAKNAAKPAQGSVDPRTVTTHARTKTVKDTPKMHLGFLPDNYISGQVPVQQANNPAAARAAALSGKKSRSAARNQAQPGPQGMMQQNIRSSSRAARPKRSVKSAPVISGMPITGRNTIGMVDTRKAAVPKSSPSVTHALPQQTNSAYSRYTSLIGGLGGDTSPQSFVSHGFAGKNAEQALKKLGYDVQDNRSIKTYAQRLEPDPYSLKDLKSVPPGTTFGSTRPVTRPTGAEAARQAIITASHRRKKEQLPSGQYSQKSLVPSFYESANSGLGNLAARFESGTEGIAAIGYDRKGGTSYGKYQIASRVGTMKQFISYLDDKAPDLANRLRSAGPANTGGRNGKMPAEWRKIASEDPQRFEVLQSDFIRTSHFEPAMRAITASTGVSFDTMPVALQEVLFSTAVQHGPSGATRIVSQAVKSVGPRKLQDVTDKPTAGSKRTGEQLITQIYSLRANQFASSTSRVQAAVRSRLKQEMREAIQMLA